MFGITKDTLLTAAVTLVLLGPWHAWFLGQELMPNPTVKKKCLSTVFGTFAGNLALAKLRTFLLNFIAKTVSLNLGSTGLRRRSFLFLVFVFETEDFLYSSKPVAVVLSKAAGPVA